MMKPAESGGSVATVAPRHPLGQRRSGSSSFVPRVLLASTTAFLLFTLAVWSGNNGKEADEGALQALWEGDPAHHELSGAKPAEVWGKPLAQFHYEPQQLKLHQLAQKTNNTAAGKHSADDSRQAVKDYFDAMVAKEESKLKPAHDEDMRVIAEERVRMSADDARKSVESLPTYLHREDEYLEAERKAERKEAAMERKIKDQYIEYDATARATSSDSRLGSIKTWVDEQGVVHGLPTKENFAGPAPASGKADTVAAAHLDPDDPKKVVKSDKDHLSGDAERETTSEYFDRIEAEEQAKIAARRAVRAKVAEAEARAKEAEAARVEREIRESPGAGNHVVEDIAKVRKDATSVSGKDETLKDVNKKWAVPKAVPVTATAPAPAVAFDGYSLPPPTPPTCSFSFLLFSTRANGHSLIICCVVFRSPVKSWEDGPGLGNGKPTQMRVLKTFKLAEMQEQLASTYLKEKSRNTQLATFRDETLHSQFVNPP